MKTALILLSLTLIAVALPDLRRVLHAQGYYDADLTVSAVDLPLPAVAGETFGSTIRVANLALNPAESVALVSSFSSDVEFGATAGCAEDPTGFPVCTLGDLPSGQSLDVTVETRVESAAAGSATLTFVATSPTGDENPLNDVITVDLPLSRQSDLEIHLDNGTGFIPQGGAQSLDYFMTVRNTGPSDGNGMQVVFQPPAIYQAEQWFCFSDAGVACEPFGSGSPFQTVDAESGGSALYIIEGTVQPTVEGSMTAQAVVTGALDSVDPVPENNTALDIDSIGLFGDGFETEPTIPFGPLRAAENRPLGAWLEASHDRQRSDASIRESLAARVLDAGGGIVALVLERRHADGSELQLVSIREGSNVIAARTRWLDVQRGGRFRVADNDGLVLEVRAVDRDGRTATETSQELPLGARSATEVRPQGRWR